MSFAARLRMGESFEDSVESYLERKQVAYARNGTEHTHPDFVSLLRCNDGETARLIRFAPDGILLSANGSVVHWEAKASVNVERQAYETYLKYHDMGCNVWLFVRDRLGQVFTQDIEQVGFIPSEAVVGRFPNPHPVDQDDWICPNRGRAGQGSGNPYRQIDTGSMIHLRDFG